MRQRLISAAVLVPVVVIIFLAGQPWLNLGIAVLGGLAAYETSQLVRRAGLEAVTWLAVAAPILAVLLFEIVIRPGGLELGWLLIAPAIALWVIVAALPALRHEDPGDGLRDWIGTIFASFYPSLLGFAAGLALVTTTVQAAPLTWQILDVGRSWLLVLVATVWTLDSAAYVAGRYHGRGRFMNHISPAKTWSGVIGGTLSAVIVCGALVWAIFGELPWWGALLGLLIAIAAQAGDLAESMLKRAAGVKDSGTLIPGHGGILDRVDSFLFAAPALYTALVVAGLLHAGGVL
jgi:phosphatidate cytidylyltransferase